MTKVACILTVLLTMTACNSFRGQPGEKGAPGQTIIGPRGPAGNDGAPGSDGHNCSVATLAVGSLAAPNGGSLITCPDGSSSVVLNGAPGANGEDGSPGTVITPVQFCQGFTQSYPSTFAEAGLCVAGVMYGVYSANGGFLAELPPGRYSSNGINSSCTFSIGPNCEVSP